MGAFWGPFVGVLATWWASFWNLDGLRCLLGAQGILESECGHIFHHFGGHIGRLFRRFWHHFLIHFWRSHFIENASARPPHLQCFLRLGSSMAMRCFFSFLRVGCSVLVCIFEVLRGGFEDVLELIF